MNNEENIETNAIRKMIVGSAPERESELDALWQEYSPQFSQREDTADFSMGVIFGSVVYDHKTMCQMWLLGFAAQKAFHAYCPYLIYSKLFNYALSNDSFVETSECTESENDFKNIIESVLRLKSLASIDDFVWPNNIPTPYKGKPNDINGSMVFDLICMSGAYCFLHELQHVRFSSDGTDLDAHEEEMACDQFAREFLLSKASDYAKLSGYPADLVLSKRAMSIAISCFLLFVITPKERWKDTESHPRIKKRIDALTNFLKISDDDYFWIYFSSLSMALIRFNKILIRPMTVENQKSYCLYLIKLLDEST